MKSSDHEIRMIDPTTITLHNNKKYDSHFIIHRNGLIEKSFSTEKVLNTIDPFNREIFIKINMGDTIQDFCSLEQTNSIIYLCGIMKEEDQSINKLTSEIKGVKPEFFRRALEL